MNKKYLFSSIYLYINLILFFGFIVITCFNYNTITLMITPLLYLSLLCCSIYIEIFILKNKKAWWIEFITIISARIFELFRMLILFYNSNKINKSTHELLKLISDEELPIFMYFGTFLNYCSFKKFNNRIIELGIFKENVNNGLLKRMNFLNIKLRKCYMYKNQVYFYKLLWNNTTIYLYSINRERNRFIKFSFDQNKAAIFLDYKLDIKKYNINNFYINGPSEAIKYFMHYYGKNWQLVYPNNIIKYGPNEDKSEKIVQTTTNIKKITYF